MEREPGRARSGSPKPARPRGIVRTIVEHAAGAPDWPHWACPCGSEPPKHGNAKPVATLVSLREPTCPFCGRTFAEEYRRPP
jgi:hypothetical protein